MRDFVGAEYIVLADPEAVAVKAFGVDDLLDDGLAAPSAFIIGSDGQILWTHISKDTQDRPTATQILSALADSLSAAKYTLYENAEAGISFMRPASWTAIPVEDPEEGPWAIFETDYGVTLQLLAEFHDPDVDLRQSVVTALQTIVPDGATPSLLGLRYAILDSGAPALRADLHLQSAEADSAAIVQAAERGGGVFIIVASGPSGLLRDQQNDINQVFNTFNTNLPSPYGIDRSRAFTMPLGEPRTLDPHVARETTSHFYVSSIFSGLVRLDEVLEVTPDLAESWEFDETGTIYTFTLRDDITFHDGKPITATDFKLSIERATDPELHSDTSRLYLGDIVGALAKMDGEAEEVSGFQALDERTIQITIDSPKDYFLAKLSYPSSYVIDTASAGALGEEWWMDNQINGSGPYELLRWDAEEVLIMKRFDGYYNPVPMEHIISPLAATPGARGLDMYRSGYLDAIYVGVASLDRIADDETVADNLNVYDQLISYFVKLDTGLPPLDDPNVRRALGLAVDRQELIDEIYFGKIQLANGLLPPGIPGYSEDLRGLTFDPVEARRLLAESQYADEPPEIVYIAVDRDGEPPLTVQFMIDSWKENLGLDVAVNLLDPDTYYYNLEDQVGHMLTYGWVADYPDPENFLDLLLHSEAHDSRYANAAFDSLVEAARETQDRQARLELFQVAEQLLLDDTGIIPLFHFNDYVLIKPYVRNFKVLALGQPDIAHVEFEGGP